MKLLSEKLAELGHTISVYTINASEVEQLADRATGQKFLPESENINGVQVRRFKVNYGLVTLIRRRIFKMWGGYRLLKILFQGSLEYWASGPMIWKMYNALRRQKPDMIMATNNRAVTFYMSYWMKRLLNIPLILMPITHFGDKWTSQSILKKIYSFADHLIACTEFEKNHFAREGIPESKISVHPLGIPFQKDARQETENIKMKYGLGREPIVAYIGSMVNGKGIDVLIRAMKIVWQQCPLAQLLLAGKKSKDFEMIINKSLDQLTPEEKGWVRNIDYFSDNEKPELFACVDIIVMASRVDAFGVTYLDAWAQGKPVIGCRNMPQETIIDDGENGLLVEYGNVNELAESIVKLLTNEELRSNMGENGKQKVLRIYNLDVYAKNIIEEYRKRLDQIKELNSLDLTKRSE